MAGILAAGFRNMLAPPSGVLIVQSMGFLPRPIDLINKAVGFDGVKISRGIPYGGHARQVLDIYAPARARGPHPVIVFYYGGSWRSGERADYGFVAARLVACGFIVVVPDYRVYPETRYPGFVEDCGRAAQWVMGRIGGYGGDAEAVFLMGHSAGAYNAVMVALAPEAPAVAGVIGLAGPYDFERLEDPAIKAIFAGAAEAKDAADTAGTEDAAEAAMRETQPIRQAHGAAPPMLLATGARDRVVPPCHTTALAERLRHLGGVVETRIYPRLGHLGILFAMLPYLAWRAPVGRDVLAFIDDCRAGILVRPHSEFSATVIRRSL
jgi:acetyl esterase/lipase